MSMELSANGANVKVRSPWGPLGLGMITFGIYNLVWYYKINREMRDFGAASGDRALGESNPGMSLLAVTLGSMLIVPPFVSYFHTVGRIQQVQRLRGKQPISTGLIVGLFIGGVVTLGLVALAIPYVLQQSLNEVWLDYKSNPVLPQTPPVGVPIAPAAEHV
jgi:hypothetical protein